LTETTEPTHTEQTTPRPSGSGDGSDRGRPAGASYQARLKGPDRLRIGLVVGALLAIVVAATVTLGASPSPSGAPSGGNQPGNTKPDRAGRSPFNLRDRFLGLLEGRGGLRGFGQITITAINGSNLSLKTDDGWTRTIAVTSTTTITKGGQTIAMADLKVGDSIRFGQTRNADGSFTVNRIAVVVPRVAGTVTAVTDNGFTLSKRDGTTSTVTVSSSTTYTVGALTPKAGTKSDVKVGSEVAVQGTQGAGNTLSAISVHVRPPTIAGQVTAKSGNTITVRRPDGTTATIHVGSATTYRVRGAANGGLPNITVGMGILAEGTQRSDEQLVGLPGLLEREALGHRHVRVQPPANEPVDQLLHLADAAYPRPRERQLLVDEYRTGLEGDRAPLADERDATPLRRCLEAE
jgi:hypothetical protein